MFNKYISEIVINNFRNYITKKMEFSNEMLKKENQTEILAKAKEIIAQLIEEGFLEVNPDGGYNIKK